REDILELTISLDDIIDGMKEFTALMDIYQILSSNTYMDQFTEYIYKSTEEILTTIELIADSKLGKIEPHVIKIKDYESKCDGLYHDSLKELFQDEKDPIKIIQYNKIYETL